MRYSRTYRVPGVCGVHARGVVGQALDGVADQSPARVQPRQTRRTVHLLALQAPVRRRAPAALLAGLREALGAVHGAGPPREQLPHEVRVGGVAEGVVLPARARRVEGLVVQLETRVAVQSPGRSHQRGGARVRGGLWQQENRVRQPQRLPPHIALLLVLPLDPAA